MTKAQTSRSTPALDLCAGGCGELPQTLTVGRLGTLELPYCVDCGAREGAAERAREQDSCTARLLERAGGGRMRGWSLDTYPDDAAARAARIEAERWLRWYLDAAPSLRHVDGCDARNLILFGDVGTGKTGLAWSLVRALCETGVDATLLNFRDYLWDCRSRFRGGVLPDERPHFVPVLALDDVGAERPTGYAVDELASLIEHRLRANRPTIVTSNYDPAELARRLGHEERVVGQRIVSRLVENADQVRFVGADRRVTARETAAA